MGFFGSVIRRLLGANAVAEYLPPRSGRFIIEIYGFEKTFRLLLDQMLFHYS